LDIINNIISGDLNTIGLIIGFFGAVLVTLFGLPSIPLLNEGSYTEIKVTPKMVTYTRLSRLGLLMIAFGFVFQLLAVPAV